MDCCLVNIVKCVRYRGRPARPGLGRRKRITPPKIACRGAKLSFSSWAFSSWESRYATHSQEYCASPSTRRRAPSQKLLHSLYVFRGIYFNGLVLRFHPANAVAILQPAKLLELFDAFQIALRKSGKFQ